MGNKKTLEEQVMDLIAEQNMTVDDVSAIMKSLKERPVVLNILDLAKEKENITLKLLHPGKGTAYALSYHPQKWAESISGGTKPNIAGLGHYHKVEYLFYRNIHMFQTGTFESQSPFMRRMNISAHMGGWILYINDLDPIGLLGDTQIGSKTFRRECLEDYYRRAVLDGVKEFFHTGDMVHGENMYRGQVYECYAHGCAGQTQAVVDEYPKIEGITTYFITGNHDLSFWKSIGMDIGLLINARRPDLVYLGQEEADIKLPTSSIKKLKMELIPYY